jgi:hypothetical protein
VVVVAILLAVEVLEAFLQAQLLYLYLLHTQLQLALVAQDLLLNLLRDQMVLIRKLVL